MSLRSLPSILGEDNNGANTDMPIPPSRSSICVWRMENGRSDFRMEVTPPKASYLPTDHPARNQNLVH